MKIKEGFLLHEVDDTVLVVAVGKAAKQFNGMITLNEVGAFLWKKLETGADEASLIAAILDEYEVDEARAETDVKAFIGKLREAGVLDE